MLKAKDLRDQTVEELEAAFNERRQQLFSLVNEMKRSKKMEKGHRLLHTKKEIARLMTVMREKELAS